MENELNIHLITVVGGRISTFEHMLDHYLGMKLDGISVYVHMRFPGDTILDEISTILRLRGLSVAGHAVGEWERIQYLFIDKTATAPRDDWFVVADQDELHDYGGDIRAIIEDCEANGFDYLRGCCIDRFSPSGELVDVTDKGPLSRQFSVGAYFTRPILGGQPSKVVAVRGGIRFTNCGHHRTSSGVGCPPHRHLVQVNHYKWTGGLCRYLRDRSSALPDSRVIKREDEKFVRYYESMGNRIDLNDKSILAAPCSPTYPHWEQVRTICEELHWRQERLQSKEPSKNSGDPPVKNLRNG